MGKIIRLFAIALFITAVAAFVTSYAVKLHVEKDPGSIDDLFEMHKTQDYVISQKTYEQFDDIFQYQNSCARFVSLNDGYIVITPPGTKDGYIKTVTKYSADFQTAEEIALDYGSKPFPHYEKAELVTVKNGIGLYDRDKHRMFFYNKNMRFVSCSDNFSQYVITGFYKSLTGHFGWVYTDYNRHLIFREFTGEHNAVRMVRSEKACIYITSKCCKVLESPGQVLLRCDYDFMLFDKHKGEIRKLKIFDDKEKYYYPAALNGKHVYFRTSRDDKKSIVFNIRENIKRKTDENRKLIQMTDGTTLEPYEKDGKYHIAVYIKNS